MWRRDEIVFRVREDLSEGEVVTLQILTPAGVVQIMGEPEDIGRMLMVRAVHLHADRPRAIGAANLGVIAQALMQRFDYDEVIVEGARREGGLRAGRFPRRIRYRRRAEPAA